MKELLSKIAKIRTRILEANLKKSGKNTFSKFQYYELSDFLPEVIKLEQELKLVSVFDTLNDDEATLTIYDLESDNKLVLRTKIAEVNVNQMIDIQRLGSQHTYIKRYLYYNYLNLTENDEVDSLDQKEVTKPVNKPTQTTTPKVVKEETPPIQPQPTQQAPTQTQVTMQIVKVKTVDELNTLYQEAKKQGLDEKTEKLFNIKAQSLKVKLIDGTFKLEETNG